MTHVQIFLEDSQYLQLKGEVLAKGKSLWEIVRESLSDHPKERENDPLVDLIGSVHVKKYPAQADSVAQYDHYLYGKKCDLCRSVSL